MRYHKLEEEIKKMPKHERQKFREMIEYGGVNSSKDYTKSSKKKSKNKSVSSNKTSKTKEFSQVDPQIFDIENE